MMQPLLKKKSVQVPSFSIKPEPIMQTPPLKSRENKPNGQFYLQCSLPTKVQPQANFSAKRFSIIDQKIQTVPVKPQLTFVSALGSSCTSPLRIVTRKTVTTDRQRSDSLDMARIVTKESTVLLQDIYKDIQSTLKKYDGIVKDHNHNKIRNDSFRTSMIKSISGSIKKSNSNAEFTIEDCKMQSNNVYQLAYDAQIETLKQQQSLLLLMFQNNTVQEQILIQQKSKRCLQLDQVKKDEQRDEQKDLEFQQRHNHITNQITKLTTLKSRNDQNQFVQRFSNHSASFSPRLDLPRQMKDKDIHICSQDEGEMKEPESRGQEVVVDHAEKLVIVERAPLPITKKPKSRQVIEIQLRKKRKDSNSVQQKSKTIGESSSIIKSPLTAKLNKLYYLVESEQGKISETEDSRKNCYSQIHARKQTTASIQQIDFTGEPQTWDFSQRNLIWKSKIVDKIRCQQEIKKKEEMKQCTFKPTIKKPQLQRNSTPKLQQSKILQTDTTNSELNRDLKEIVNILDEFQEFQQVFACHSPKI